MSKIYQIFYRKSTDDSRDLDERFSEYSDEHISKILKQRTYYTHEAAQLAIDEAIERGILNSEQDLMSDEYRVEELKFSWFPKPANKENKKRISSSIGRSLVFCGILPVIFGLVKMNTANYSEGSLILLFGLLWILLSSQMLKSYRRILPVSLLVANALAAGYVYFRLLSAGVNVFMDYFICTVMFLLINYGLVYIGRISEQRTA